jgi:hypothetical protein
VGGDPSAVEWSLLAGGLERQGVQAFRGDPMVLAVMENELPFVESDHPLIFRMK